MTVSLGGGIPSRFAIDPTNGRGRRFSTGGNHVASSVPKKLSTRAVNRLCTSDWGCG